MTWPNELHRLEEDLAAGRLTVDEFRRRRDELLGVAPAVDPLPAVPPGAGDPAGARPDASSPFPPPFRWEPSSPPGRQPPTEQPETERPETEQADGAQAGREPGGAERAECTAQRPLVEKDELSEPTQAVPAPPPLPPQPASPQQPAGPPPPHGPAFPVSEPTFRVPEATFPVPEAASTGTPWGSFADQDHADWLSSGSTSRTTRGRTPRQGAELFGSSATSPRSTQLAGLAVVGVLVLVLAGASVAYVLSSRDQAAGESRSAPPAVVTAATPPPEPPPPGPPPVDTSGALVEPPGVPRDGGGLLDLARLIDDPLLPRAVVDALAAAGMADGVLKTTTEGRSTIGMFAFAVRDAPSAGAVVGAIRDEQLRGGLREDPARALRGVVVLGTDEDNPATVYRAAYVLYDRVIYVEVFGPDRAEVLAIFDGLLHQQVTFAPPTLR